MQHVYKEKHTHIHTKTQTNIHAYQQNTCIRKQYTLKRKTRIVYIQKTTIQRVDETKNGRQKTK